MNSLILLLLLLRIILRLIFLLLNLHLLLLNHSNPWNIALSLRLLSHKFQKRTRPNQVMIRNTTHRRTLFTKWILNLNLTGPTLGLLTLLTTCLTTTYFLFGLLFESVVVYTFIRLLLHFLSPWWFFIWRRARTRRVLWIVIFLH